MRIISGTAKGTKLNTLEGLSTRPTLDRVKESLFNIISNKIVDSDVLDLFSGSGALAIECLSRGANLAILCDNSIKAIQIIQSNIEKTKFIDKATILKNDYKKVIRMQNQQFDIIFIDPPYEANIAVDAVRRILEKDILKTDGIIIIETDNEKREQEELKNIKDIEIYDLRKYGRVKLLFLNRKG